MLKIHVWSHKDGDHLVIVRVPWWHGLAEWLAGRICPCHGLTGWLSRRSERVEGQFMYWYSAWIGWSHHRLETELFRVPIENSCVAEQAIWPEEEDWLCWREDCPVHEHQL